MLTTDCTYKVLKRDCMHLQSAYQRFDICTYKVLASDCVCTCKLQSAYQIGIEFTYKVLTWMTKCHHALSGNKSSSIPAVLTKWEGQKNKKKPRFLYYL